MEFPLSTSVNTDTRNIYVTLLNALSAFGETFKQQIVNSSPPPPPPPPPKKNAFRRRRDITKFKLDTYI